MRSILPKHNFAYFSCLFDQICGGSAEAGTPVDVFNMAGWESREGRVKVYYFGTYKKCMFISTNSSDNLLAMIIQEHIGGKRAFFFLYVEGF